VALADKMDALVGFFGIGQIPTGDKDPFGLRRAALGVLRILMEKPLALDLADLIADAGNGFPAGMLTSEYRVASADFLRERLRHLLRGDDAADGHDPKAIDAVLALAPTRIDQVLPRLEAVKIFAAMPEAAALAAANKRIVNILKKSEAESAGKVDVTLLQEEAEKGLFAQLTAISPGIESQLAASDYTGALKALAGLRAAVDSFFDNVMVNADEPLTRANRLALLSQLANLMNRVADISRL